MYGYDDLTPPQCDWSQYEIDISHFCEKRADVCTAIAVIGADRLTYYKRTLRTLAKNKLAHQLPVYAFLDYPPYSTTPDEDQEAMVAETLTHFPDAHVICRKVNFGCGRNIIDARRQLFDHLEYEKVFIIEDDMLLSDNYLQLCMNMMEWAESKWSNIGVVQGWNKCFLTEAQKKERLSEVLPTMTNWWGYLMHRSCWASMREGLYRYERKWLGWEYNARPHQPIADWLKKELFDFPMRLNALAPGEAWEEAQEKFWNAPATGQDAATMLGMHNGGWLRLAPVVNRGQYIGRMGIHMNPSWFINDRFDEILLHQFEEDRSLTSFSTNHLPPPEEEDEEFEGMRSIKA